MAVGKCCGAGLESLIAMSSHRILDVKPCLAVPHPRQPYVLYVGIAFYADLTFYGLETPGVKILASDIRSLLSCTCKGGDGTCKGCSTSRVTCRGGKYGVKMGR